MPGKNCFFQSLTDLVHFGYLTAAQKINMDAHYYLFIFCATIRMPQVGHFPTTCLVSKHACWRLCCSSSLFLI